MKYLVAYRASAYITNGAETVPVYENRIFSDILELENDFAISQELIDGFKNIITKSIYNSISEAINKDYTPDIDVEILAITRIEG